MVTRSEAWATEEEWQGQESVNVDSGRFREGRGAEKKTTQGGCIIVSRKNSYRKRKVTLDVGWGLTCFVSQRHVG
jgi:hypothetical protein